MHLSVIVQQGQHRRAPSAPALPVAKFIFVRKSTKNPPISTASCPFFPLQALPASSQCAASATAPHCSKYSTSPHRLPHPAVHPLSSPRRTLPSALITSSPMPLRTCPMAFPGISKPALPHFPSRTQYIYNVPETKLHIFQKKRSQRFANMPNHPTFAIAKRKQGLPSEAEHSRKHIGRLAQLVQSVCLTSRGSAVRIRQRPHKQTTR